MKAISSLPLCLILILNCQIQLLAQTFSCETKIKPFDGENFDRFGQAVDLCTDLLVVGAWDDDDHGDYSGSAYFYEWDGTNWIVTKITASDAAAQDKFGLSVACSNNRILVGSPDDHIAGQSNVGSSYLYEWNGVSWNETKITSSDGSSFDNYGRDVAFDGDRMVIGAPGFGSPPFSDSGAVYVYDWDGSAWIETKLVPITPEGTANLDELLLSMEIVL